MGDVDPDIRKVLEYVARGRRYVDVEKYPDATARRALGRILDEEAERPVAGDTIGSGGATP